MFSKSQTPELTLLSIANIFLSFLICGPYLHSSSSSSSLLMCYFRIASPLSVEVPVLLGIGHRQPRQSVDGCGFRGGRWEQTGRKARCMLVAQTENNRWYGRSGVKRLYQASQNNNSYLVSFLSFTWHSYSEMLDMYDPRYCWLSTGWCNRLTDTSENCPG